GLVRTASLDQKKPSRKRTPSGGSATNGSTRQQKNPPATKKPAGSVASSSSAKTAANSNRTGRSAPGNSSSAKEGGVGKASAQRNQSGGSGTSSQGSEKSGRSRGSQAGQGKGKGPPSFLLRGGLSGGGGNGESPPLTGDGFRQWSNRMRDVEEMLEDPKLRAKAAAIRDRGRAMRVEFKRHARKPNWDVVRGKLLKPLLELQNHISEEIANRESKRSLAPIDRDPVPLRFDDLVRRSYERLAADKERAGAGGDK
ncbi:MAG: hypothetical protein IID45_00975, partial [Planctomycetes bacterium]|nr:hypothetical protein [Planctomycetota bacterium]